TIGADDYLVRAASLPLVVRITNTGATNKTYGNGIYACLYYPTTSLWTTTTPATTTVHFAKTDPAPTTLPLTIVASGSVDVPLAGFVHNGVNTATESNLRVPVGLRSLIVFDASTNTPISGQIPVSLLPRVASIPTIYCSVQ
ncbi:MAG: hypothetical protein ACAI25_12250, partial [Planctomycetota bacterium]